MKGSVLDFNIQQNSGVISHESGERYSFNGADWKSETAPKKGMIVDFVEGENSNATEIYLLGNSGVGLDNISPPMTKAGIAMACAIAGFFIPFIGLLFAIAGLIVGRQARKAAQEAGDDNAALVGLVAVITSIIVIVFAVIGMFTLLFVGSTMMGLGAFSLGSAF